MQNLIKLYHLVIKLGAINNDRATAKEWTAAEATGGLDALWRQKINVLSSNRGFLTYENIITEKQTIDDLAKQGKWLT